MKKSISIILSAIMLLSVSVVYADDTDVVGGKITLTQFLGAAPDKTKEIRLNSEVVDKVKFFEIADSLILTSSLNPASAEMDGIYITAQTTNDELLYTYIAPSGGADKYSAAMSRLPYAMYTVDDMEKLNSLYALAKTPLKKVSDWAKNTVADFESTYGMSDSDFGTSNYTQNITREIFCNMADYTLRKNGYDTGHNDNNPFEDVASPTVSRLYTSGIINGKSQTIFAPNDYITREEAATILYRMAEFMKKDIPTIKEAAYYNDDNQISDWALSAVKAMREMGIMNGTSDNNFTPKDNYTIEQAIATMKRMYD